MSSAPVLSVIFIFIYYLQIIRSFKDFVCDELATICRRYTKFVETLDPIYFSTGKYLKIR